MEAIQSGDEFYKEWKSFAKATKQRQIIQIRPYNEQIREKEHLLHQYKKGA
jgi:hypothetical protein